MEQHDNTGKPEKYQIDDPRNILEYRSGGYSRPADADIGDFTETPSSSVFMEYPNTLQHGYTGLGNYNDLQASMLSVNSGTNTNLDRQFNTIQEPQLRPNMKKIDQFGNNIQQDIHFQHPNYSQHVYENDERGSHYLFPSAINFPPTHKPSVSQDLAQRSRFDPPSYQMSSNYRYPPRIGHNYTFSKQSNEAFDDSGADEDSHEKLYRHYHTGSYNPPMSHRAQQSSLGYTELVNSHQRMLSSNRIDELDSVIFPSPLMYQMNSLPEFPVDRTTELQQSTSSGLTIPGNASSKSQLYGNYMNYSIPESVWSSEQHPIYQLPVPIVNNRVSKESNIQDYVTKPESEKSQRPYQEYSRNSQNKSPQVYIDQNRPYIDRSEHSYDASSRSAYVKRNPRNSTAIPWKMELEKTTNRGHSRSGSILKETPKSHRRSKSSLRHLPDLARNEHHNFHKEILKKGGATNIDFNESLNTPRNRDNVNLSLSGMGDSELDNTRAPFAREVKTQNASRKRNKAKYQREPVLLAAKNPMYDFQLQNQERGLGIDIDHSIPSRMKIHSNEMDENHREDFNDQASLLYGKEIHSEPGHSSGLTPLLLGDSPSMGSHGFSSDYNASAAQRGATLNKSKIMDPWIYPNELIGQFTDDDLHNLNTHTPVAGPSNIQENNSMQKIEPGVANIFFNYGDQHFAQGSQQDIGINYSDIPHPKEPSGMDNSSLKSQTRPLSLPNQYPRVNIPLGSRIPRTLDNAIPQIPQGFSSRDNDAPSTSTDYSITGEGGPHDHISFVHLNDEPRMNTHDSRTEELSTVGKISDVPELKGNNNSKDLAYGVLSSNLPSLDHEGDQQVDKIMRKKQTKVFHQNEKSHISKEAKKSNMLLRSHRRDSFSNRTIASSRKIKDLIAGKNSSQTSLNTPFDLEAEVPDKSQFSEEARAFKWSPKEHKELLRLLDAGERYKWKYISEQVSHSLSKRIPVRACRTKFEALFGKAENSSRLGSSLFYMAYRSGWLTLKNRKTQNEDPDIDNNEQVPNKQASKKEFSDETSDDLTQEKNQDFQNDQSTLGSQNHLQSLYVESMISENHGDELMEVEGFPKRAHCNIISDSNKEIGSSLSINPEADSTDKNHKKRDEHESRDP